MQCNQDESNSKATQDDEAERKNIEKKNRALEKQKN
jgi:hypothetical protein